MGENREWISQDEARGLYDAAETGHDFDHILRVLATAERLAVEEGADLKVVRAAALLHDTARLEEDRSPGVGIDHAELAGDRARRLLLQKGAPEEFAAAVAEAVAAHRFRGARRPQTLEGQILFDADKLDALGAIGIARAYAIGGSMNQKLYSEPEAGGEASRDQHHSGHSPLAEFSVKLSKLAAAMYTPTARQIGAERQAFMESFFQRLKEEVAGEA